MFPGVAEDRRNTVSRLHTYAKPGAGTEGKITIFGDHGMEKPLISNAVYLFFYFFFFYSLFSHPVRSSKMVHRDRSRGVRNPTASAPARAYVPVGRCARRPRAAPARRPASWSRARNGRGWPRRRSSPAPAWTAAAGWTGSAARCWPPSRKRAARNRSGPVMTCRCRARRGPCGARRDYRRGDDIAHAAAGAARAFRGGARRKSITVRRYGVGARVGGEGSVTLSGWLANEGEGREIDARLHGVMITFNVIVAVKCRYARTRTRYKRRARCARGCTGSGRARSRTEWTQGNNNNNNWRSGVSSARAN